MDEKERVAEGIIVIACSILFASGVGIVTHSVGWLLVALPLVFWALRLVRKVL